MRNVDMAQLDATNGPGSRSRLHEDRLTSRLTRRDPTNYADPNAASDPGQKAAPDAGHLADSREVGEREPLYTNVRQTRYGSLF